MTPTTMPRRRASSSLLSALVFTALVFIMFIVTLLAFTACGDSSSGVNTGGALVPRTVSNLRPDSLSVLYFSFDKDTVIPASLAATDKWDIRLPFLSANSRSVDILLNSGNVNPNGKTRGITIDSAFDLVSFAPSEAQMRQEDTAVSRRIVSVDLFGGGMFNYNAAQRTIVPNPQKTLALKTAGGNYVKVQFVNLYKDAPSAPTMFTPLGYYRIRYVKNTDRNLK